RGQTTFLESARPDPGLVAWSPLGGAFALLYPGSEWAQVFAGAGNAFRLVDEFTTTASRIAVSDDGAATLLLSDGGLTLRLGGAITLLNERQVSSFTFLAGESTPAFHSSGELVVGGNRIPIQADEVFLSSLRPGRLLAAVSSSASIQSFDSAGT